MRFAESNPIFQQIADMLADSVLRQRYRPGERIPSVRDMAVSVEVNPNTVQRAYTILQEWGVIENQRGLGYSVAADGIERARANKRRRFEHEELPRVAEYLDTLGMSNKEFTELLTRVRSNTSSHSVKPKGT